MSQRILRLPDVKSRTGLSRTSIYKLMAENAFPRQIHLGKRMIGWPEFAIEEWITQRVHASQNRLLTSGCK